MRLLLVGNQNCGKTTLFNALTGSDQHTGNWPGVTVTGRNGLLRGRTDVTLTDLPGTYSLYAYTDEERVTSDALLAGGYDAVINVADASCLARSLYLTFQLKRLGVPMVLALNMMDEAKRAGLRIDTAALAEQLGLPVVPVVARTGEGIERLTDAALQCSGRPQMNSSPEKPDAADVCEIYRQIDRLLAGTVRASPRQWRFTDRADRIMTHPLAGLSVMSLLLSGVFWLAFGPASGGLQGMFAALIDRAALGARNILDRAGVSPWLLQFVTDGLLAGVGSVLSFLPTILLLLLGLSLLEDSGVMVRAVYLLDRPLRRIGLSGRAFIPLLLGFGCTVPAAMAVRSMPGRRESRATLLLLPFMSCGAKLPVYALLAAAILPGMPWLVIAALYLSGLLLSVVAAMLMDRLSPGGRAAPLVMELPPYRLPTLRSVLRGMRSTAGAFVRRTFSIILLATACVWLAQHLTLRMTWTANVEDSLLGLTAGWVAPIFAPLGFGSPQAAIALLTGLLAKESIVSTLTVLCGAEGIGALLPTGAAALSFLTFVMLYPPCVAAMSAMGESFGRKRTALLSALRQTVLAWGCALIVYVLAGWL